jgi:hypothetical protein
MMFWSIAAAVGASRDGYRIYFSFVGAMVRLSVWTSDRLETPGPGYLAEFVVDEASGGGPEASSDEFDERSRRVSLRQNTSSGLAQSLEDTWWP